MKAWRLAQNFNKKNKDNSIIYSLHGDGELQEGQIWEAALYASANKVDNYIATIDYNGRQIDGDVEKCYLWKFKSKI